MNKIIFACEWHKQREKTWSGTTLNVYKELLKHYEIENFDFNRNVFSKMLNKISKHMNHYDLQYHMLLKENKRFKKMYRDQSATVFQFAETPLTDYTNNYIYQDLSVEYLYNCKKSKNPVFLYSGFNNVSEKYLKERMENQRVFYNKCKAIFTMGKWLADYMVNECNIPKEKVHSIGAGINLENMTFDSSQRSGNKILFVGKDFKRKGGYILLEAFKILREKYNKNAELYIIGPQKETIKNHIMGVNFIGEVKHEDVFKYYNMCDIFCMPSYFEAYGIVFAEALCYGLPCIGRNCFAMNEIIEDGVNGLLLKNDNADELARLMSSLLNNTKISQYVNIMRDKYIKYYSWERVVNDIVKVIKL